jgi:hypothetical protein
MPETVCPLRTFPLAKEYDRNSGAIAGLGRHQAEPCGQIVPYRLRPYAILRTPSRWMSTWTWKDGLGTKASNKVDVICCLELCIRAEWIRVSRQAFVVVLRCSMGLENPTCCAERRGWIIGSMQPMIVARPVTHNSLDDLRRRRASHRQLFNISSSCSSRVVKED